MAGVRNYLIVTASYWSFTLTDGALRMLVLLHFYTLGYTPFTLATLFLLYGNIGKLKHDVAPENARCLRKSRFIPSHCNREQGALSMTLSQYALRCVLAFRFEPQGLRIGLIFD